MQMLLLKKKSMFIEIVIVTIGRRTKTKQKETSQATKMIPPN